MMVYEMTQVFLGEGTELVDGFVGHEATRGRKPGISIRSIFA